MGIMIEEIIDIGLFDLKKKKEYSNRICTIIKATMVELMWSNIDRIRL